MVKLRGELRTILDTLDKDTLINLHTEYLAKVIQSDLEIESLTRYIEKYAQQYNTAREEKEQMIKDVDLYTQIAEEIESAGRSRRII